MKWTYTRKTPLMLYIVALFTSTSFEGQHELVTEEAVQRAFQFGKDNQLNIVRNRNCGIVT